MRTSLTKALGTMLLCGIMAVLLSSCTSGESANGKVQVEFFQNKPEAKGTFDELIKTFNAEHSDIQVTQVNPPDAETVLKTRVVKNDVPDIMAMGATDTYSILAQSEIFADLTDSSLTKTIDPNYIQMLKDVTGMEEVTGIPYATNANGIMYNKTLFKEMGLEVPKTWDELIATAKRSRMRARFRFTSPIRMTGRPISRSMRLDPTWSVLISISIVARTR